MARALHSGKVLVLSPHVVTAALVGWYVELAHLEPAFPEPGELPDDAVARVRPLLVVLVDTDLPDGGALNDLLVARTAKRGAGLALFSGRPPTDEARDWAHRHEVPLFTLPIDLESFGRVLDQAYRRLTGDRRMGQRRVTTVERALDGTLIYHDAAGRVWYVYDRRSAERRDAMGAPFRAFIEVGGAERRVALSETDAAVGDEESLAGQFARSVPV